MSFWEHGEREKQKQLSQPNKFLVFFVFKNRKQFLKTPTKQTLGFQKLFYSKREHPPKVAMWPCGHVSCPHHSFYYFTSRKCFLVLKANLNCIHKTTQTRPCLPRSNTFGARETGLGKIINFQALFIVIF